MSDHQPEDVKETLPQQMYRLYGPSKARLCLKDSGLEELLTLKGQCVQIFKNQLKEFHDNYALCSWFVGETIGKPDWCLLDVMVYWQKKTTTPQPTQTEEEIAEEVAERCVMRKLLFKKEKIKGE